MDLHDVFGVVEVNDVNIEDEDSRAGDEVSCRGRESSRASKIFKGDGRREELTHSVSSVGQVGRDGHRDLLASAQAQQGFVHTLYHVAHPHVCVVGAVSLVAGKESVWLRLPDQFMK